MPSTKPEHWAKGTPAVAAYVLLASIGANQGLDQLYPLRYDAYTASDASKDLKRIRNDLSGDIEDLKEDLQSAIDMLRSYSDANREMTSHKVVEEITDIKVYLARNYYTKAEIPPQRVSVPLERHGKWIDNAEKRLAHLHELLFRLELKLNSCCGPDANRTNADDIQNKISGRIVQLH